MSRGALCLMLQNRIYRGEIVHKGAANPGEHAAIVGEELWSSVQRRLETNGVERHETRDAAAPNFLTGILIDASGEPMTPTHAVKKGVQYRYYVSRHLVTGTRGDEGSGQTSGQRIPAANLEGLVLQRLRSFFANSVAVINLCLDVGATRPLKSGRTMLQRKSSRLWTTGERMRGTRSSVR